MTRAVRDVNLSTRNARRKLRRRRKPYWRLIEHGRHIGYRRTAKGGTWAARLYVGNERYTETRLGTTDDGADADGVEVFNWAQAQEKAREWFVRKQRAREGLSPDPARTYTVADALADYLEWYKAHKRAYADTKAYVDAHILPALGHLEVAKLRTATIARWHEELATKPARRRTKPGQPQNYGPDPTSEESQRSRKATANRILSVLKAALNKAHRDSEVSDNSAWAGAKRFRGVDSARLRFLERDEAIRLVNAADPAFRPIVKGALLTGARYGELASLKVGDFRNGKLHVARSKSGEGRWITLTAEGRRSFDEVTAGRTPKESMFVRPGRDGRPRTWGRSHQQEPMRATCRKAGIEPLGFHQLRHSYASMSIMSGMFLIVLAENLGHRDTRMVERHYGHLASSFKDQVIEEHAPKFGFGETTNVEHLRLDKARRG